MGTDALIVLSSSLNEKLIVYCIYEARKEKQQTNLKISR